MRQHYPQNKIIELKKFRRGSSFAKFHLCEFNKTLKKDLRHQTGTKQIHFDGSQTK